MERGHGGCRSFSCATPPLRPAILHCVICTDSVITPDTVYERMEEDMAVADLVLWVGISFQQSASTQYFRNVRNVAEYPSGAKALCTCFQYCKAGFV